MAQNSSWWEHLLFRVRAAGRVPDAERAPHRRWVALTVSILLSGGLWFTLSMRETYPDVIELPIRVENLPSGLTLQSAIPPAARVQVEGEGWQLLQLIQQPPVLRIDARALGDEGEIDLQSLIPLRQFPGGIKIESVSPSTLQIVFDSRVEKRVPVVLRSNLQLSSSFDFTSPPSVLPDSVTVSGPESIVASLTGWPTETVSRRDVSRSISEPVMLLDTLQQLVSVDRDRVMVRAEVDQYTEGRQQVPVRAIGLPPDIEEMYFNPAYVEVIYRIPLGQYEEINASDFTAHVTYASIVSDTTGAVSPTLQLPDGVPLRNVRITPRRVDYFIALSGG